MTAADVESEAKRLLAADDAAGREVKTSAQPKGKLGTGQAARARRRKPGAGP
ncbi:MAG TPA: hypothetical protein VKE74_16310 [Gemmataceae bacterium]|nr:hypothetical protein [Gemmataceae bacterium]